jgi:hypothetical protein
VRPFYALTVACQCVARSNSSSSVSVWLGGARNSGLIIRKHTQAHGHKCTVATNESEKTGRDSKAFANRERMMAILARMVQRERDRMMTAIEAMILVPALNTL